MSKPYEDYLNNPHEHLKTAERMAETATGILGRSEALSLVYAQLATAHAQIALGQMQGAMRA